VLCRYRHNAGTLVRPAGRPNTATSPKQYALASMPNTACLIAETRSTTSLIPLEPGGSNTGRFDLPTGPPDKMLEGLCNG
jgi:hypothetical protein